MKKTYENYVNYESDSDHFRLDFFNVTTCIVFLLAIFLIKFIISAPISEDKINEYTATATYLLQHQDGHYDTIKQDFCTIINRGVNKVIIRDSYNFNIFFATLENGKIMFAIKAPPQFIMYLFSIFAAVVVAIFYYFLIIGTGILLGKCGIAD